MYIIVGLGNPGKQYENTRHNMGFLAVDLLAEKYNIDVNKIKFKALVGEGRIAGQKVLLVKPQTYMNLSGEAVRQAMDFYKIVPEELIVIYDDIDIPTGTFRIRKKGSPGTHNGMRNIFQHIQTNDFPRIRVGIGKAKGDMVNHVLGNFSKEEGVLVTKCIKACDDIVEEIMKNGAQSAMNKYNGMTFDE